MDYATPLDLALQNNHEQVVTLLSANGGLTMGQIVRMAATRIQALWRSYKIRQSFIEHRDLLLRHERLRQRRRRSKQLMHNAGAFLGHVIEETHQSTAALKL